MYAWYFSRNDRRLRYGDDRKITVGVTHEVDGPPVLCENGLHASKRLIDALSYAPGGTIWLVELGGDIVVGDNKVVATRRTYLACLENEDLLREFARKCALEVIHLWNAPNVVQKYLETGNEELRAAARVVASTVSMPLSDPAYWEVTRSTVWCAAKDAAWCAAGPTACTAAITSARNTADAIAGDRAKHRTTQKFNTLLTEMVLDHIELP